MTRYSDYEDDLPESERDPKTDNPLRSNVTWAIALFVGFVAAFLGWLV